MTTNKADTIQQVNEFFRLLWPGADEIAEASTGDKITLWTVPGRRAHQFDFRGINNIGPVVARFGNHEVYNLIAAQGTLTEPNKERGSYETTTILPAVALDIDIKGPGHAESRLPETLDDALSLARFIAPCPPTFIVHSGGGIQPYWTFHEPIYLDTPDVKASVQTAMRAFMAIFKAEARRRGWEIDSTCDLARVLRVPGSINHKNGDARPVSIIDTTEATYDLADFEEYWPENLDSLTINTVEYDDTDFEPADAEKMRGACAWVQHCIDDAATLKEPEWYALLTLLARCEHGHQIAHEWSKAHAGYSESHTNNKLHHAMRAPGPYTCEYVRRELGAGQCATCPKAGQVKTPLVLGRESGEVKISKRRAQNDVVQRLNKQHAVVRLGGKTLVLNEEVDHQGRPDISLSAVQDFHNYYCNDKITIDNDGKPKDVSVSKIWIASTARRQYKGIVMDPNRGDNGFYNLWRGFAVDPRQGDWSLYRKHLFEVICDNNQAAYDYLIAWLADMVQNPGGSRPGVSIVLQGGRGVGKGVFMRPVSKILGAHYLQITNRNQLTGRFNSHLKNALGVFADEAFWAGDKASEGALKGIITEDRIMIEPKGKDAYSVENHVRLIMASNEEWVVPAGLDERRFLVLAVSPIYQQNKQYFAALIREIDSGGAEAMLYDLLNMDISGVDLRSPPCTNALTAQKTHSMSPLQHWWFDKLDTSDETTWDKAPKVTELHKEYVEYCHDRGARRTDPIQIWGKALRDICPQVERRRLRDDQGRRHYVMELPSLTECRMALEMTLGGQIQWSNEACPPLDGDVSLGDRDRDLPPF